VTLLREVITIPERVTDSDFVMQLAEGVSHASRTLAEYVVTDSLRQDFAQALGLVGQGAETGRSQAAFLHGSFGSGKSHFMAVLHEILAGNPDARGIPELAEAVHEADRWLKGSRVLPLTYHLLGARSMEEQVLGGYRRQILERHPDAPPPAVHRSDGLLADAVRWRERFGDGEFFAALNSGGTAGGSPGWTAAQYPGAGPIHSGWDPATFAAAAAQAPGTADRDRLVSDLTRTLFTNSVHSGEYLDIDTGLAVLTQHAKSLGYDVVVLFLDELVLWLSQHLSNLEFVNNEGGKLAKFVESADQHRPAPLVSFVARQRDLTEFLGPHIPGAERQAFADVFRHGRGRFATIELAERNLPLIAERRLLTPKPGGARIIDDAFAAVQRRRDVWDTLVVGNQYGDAGIGSDATVFRKLYPFSPALVATLVSLSQALQRERTALRVMAQLLTKGRDRLRVNDVIGVAELFDELVNTGELPDNPQLKKHFLNARDLYRKKLRPLLLHRNGQTEATVAGLPAEHQFHVDDKLIKTLLLAALAPDVPALTNLTAPKLHALNYGSLTSPVPGLEPSLVIGRLRDLNPDIGELQIGEGTDPLISLELSEVDYGAILERVPTTEDNPGARRRLLRELVCAELAIEGAEGLLTVQPYQHEWRGRRHPVDVLFANVRDRAELPDREAQAAGDRWRIVLDYPFDGENYTRRSDSARIDDLAGRLDTRTVFWLPLHLTEERLGLVGTLVKLNYVLAGERLYTLASDLAPADRVQAKAMLEQQQRAARARLVECLKQAYGVAKALPGDVDIDPDPVLRSLAAGFHPARPIGGTLKASFAHLLGQVLRWSYPGTPNLPEDEPAVTPAQLRKVLDYAQRAVGDPARQATVETADRKHVQRIVNHLRLGEYSEGIYAVKAATMWWTGHFLSRAKANGYTDRIPVSVLRELTDQPAARGLDRAVQSLIVAVFALDQDLSWFRYDARVVPPPLEGIAEDLELRPSRLPDEAVWKVARDRAAALLGVTVSPLRNAPNVAIAARDTRETARRVLPDTRTLVRLLGEHADPLGLDRTAKTGRLTTARRVERLLDQLVAEPDDPVLLELLASYDLGDGVEPAAASRYTGGAKAQADALSRTSWTVLAVLGRQGGDAGRSVLEQLQDTARREDLSADLAAGLRTAIAEAERLLTPPEPAADIGGRPEPPSCLPLSGQPPMTGTALPTGAGTVTGPPSPGAGATDGSDEATARDSAQLGEVVARIEAVLREHPGRAVRITWVVE
jgi:hypothetical protein